MKILLLFVFILFSFTYASFLSVGQDRHLFYKDYDFDSLFLDDDGQEWNENWFMPLVLLRGVSRQGSAYASVFVRIQGKGFVKHSVEAYRLLFTNPETQAVLFSSPFQAASTSQIIDFSFDVHSSLLESVFQLNLTHFSKPVPFEPFFPSPHPLNNVNGAKVPTVGSRHIFLSSSIFHGGEIPESDFYCTKEGGSDSKYISLISTSEMDVREKVKAASVSPLFMQDWLNLFDDSLVFDAQRFGAHSLFEAGWSASIGTIRDCNGGSNSDVWTGSTYFGSKLIPNCNNWTSSSTDSQAAYGNQMYGSRGLFFKAEEVCSARYRVMCLEVQGPEPHIAANLDALQRKGGFEYTAQL